MGAAWRQVREGAEFDQVIELVAAVNDIGMEVCCTLGMLSEKQATRLKEAGLYAYNHNIDTSREHYSRIIQTRTYDDRLNTIANVRAAGLTVCTGGILGMGESENDRISFIHQLASFDPQPESITVNTLVPFDGTPLEKSEPISPLAVVRVVATLRIVAPHSMIRLSAGRLGMSEEAQFLCFLAGANSIFLGEKLLTSPNPATHQDQGLMEKLGYHFHKSEPHAEHC
jgi:biotin synthase